MIDSTRNGNIINLIETFDERVKEKFPKWDIDKLKDYLYNCLEHGHFYKLRDYHEGCLAVQIIYKEVYLIVLVDIPTKNLVTVYKRGEI